jgi:hypothetical protein
VTRHAAKSQQQQRHDDHDDPEFVHIPKSPG